MLVKNLLKVLSGVSLLAFLTGCSGEPGDGIGSVDLSQYMPKTSMTKVFDQYDQWPGDGSEENRTYTEVITVSDVNGNRVIVTTHDGREISKNVINENNITSLSGWIDTVTDRYIDLGDMYYDYHTHVDDLNANMTYQCTLEANLTHFEMHDHSYSGDIYKNKCIMSFKDIPTGDERHDSYSIVYSYVEKDIGLIAEIGDHCYPYDRLSLTDDRNLSDCPDDKKGHSYKFLRE